MPELFAFLSQLSGWILPALLFFSVVIASMKGVPLMDAFLDGAWQGVTAMAKMLPVLIMMMSASAMLEASGLLTWVSTLLAPVGLMLGIPAELLPLTLIKPLSGAGAIALLQNTLTAYGADSFLGRAASTLMGASDTAVYVGAMYLNAAQAKHGRYALPVSLLASFIGTWVAIAIVKFM